MLSYIIRRLLIMIPTLVAISIISFTIIQLPPGDFLTTYVAVRNARGETVDPTEVESLRQRFGLDQPMYIQYLRWAWNFLHGDFGHSFEWNRPVSSLIAERIPLTIVISFTTLLFTWLVSVPIGIYSAVRQYSWVDYLLTFIGFIGLATPSFLFALVLLWFSYAYLGMSIGGLFSPEYPGGALELGQNPGPSLAPLDTGHHSGHCPYGKIHPHYSGKPSGRTEEAVRYCRKSQGSVRSPLDPEISGSRGHQPFGQHNRLDSAGTHFRDRYYRRGPEPSNFRASTA